MSQSFNLIVDGIIDALRARVLPVITDDVVRGQTYGIIFALNGLKLGADWALTPLLQQVQLQDEAFAGAARLANGMALPPLPTIPRVSGDMDAATVEALRDAGDRTLGELLHWTADEMARTDQPEIVKKIQLLVRHLIRDQLKIEIAITAPSMFHEMATGEDYKTGV